MVIHNTDILVNRVMMMTVKRLKW